MLVGLGLGWTVFAILQVTAAIGLSSPTVLKYAAGILVIGGGILSTFAIYERGVARGAARWVLAVPTVVSIVWVVFAFGWIEIPWSPIRHDRGPRPVAGVRGHGRALPAQPQGRRLTGSAVTSRSATPPEVG